MRTLAASVLFFEAVIVVLVVPVAISLSDVAPVTAVVVGALFALACLMTAAMLKHEWAYGVGWGLQVGLIASGFVVPAMFFLGALFAGLWAVGLSVGRKGERVRAERTAAADAAAATNGPGKEPADPAG